MTSIAGNVRRKSSTNTNVLMFKIGVKNPTKSMPIFFLTSPLYMYYNTSIRTLSCDVMNCQIDDKKNNFISNTTSKVGYFFWVNFLTFFFSSSFFSSVIFNIFSRFSIVLSLAFNCFSCEIFISFISSSLSSN